MQKNSKKIYFSDITSVITLLKRIKNSEVTEDAKKIDRVQCIYDNLAKGRWKIWKIKKKY